MEKFQREVTKGHSTAKKWLIGKGGQKNTPPFTNKPSYERSKSAPAGFGALGEAEGIQLGLAGGVAGGIRTTIPAFYDSQLRDKLKDSSPILKNIYSKSEIREEIKMQQEASEKRLDSEPEQFTPMDDMMLLDQFMVLFTIRKTTPNYENKINEQAWESTKKRLEKDPERKQLIYKLLNSKEQSVIFQSIKDVLKLMRPNYVKFTKNMEIELEKFKVEVPDNDSTLKEYSKSHKKNKTFKVRLIKKVDEDKLISPEQVKKDREKRIHKPKEREREKKTGIISPNLATFYEF